MNVSRRYDTQGYMNVSRYFKNTEFVLFLFHFNRFLDIDLSNFSLEIVGNGDRFEGLGDRHISLAIPVSMS